MTSTTRAPSNTRPQAGSLVGQGALDADTERVQRDEHDRLNRDATQDVADRDVHLPVDGRGDGDRNLWQVRGHREQDQTAYGRAEVQSLGQHVGVVRQEDTGHPDRDGTAGEHQKGGPQRKARQEHARFLTSSTSTKRDGTHRRTYLARGEELASTRPGAPVEAGRIRPPVGQKRRDDRLLGAASAGLVYGGFW